MNLLDCTCKPIGGETSGAFVLSQWVPFDVWQKIAVRLTSLLDLQSFQRVCLAAYFAVAHLQAPRKQQVCDHFCIANYPFPSDLVDHVLIVHPVPPKAESMILFVDSASGIDLVWLNGSCMKSVTLGLETAPAQVVNNIRFSPDYKHIAFLVILAQGGDTQAGGLDPLHRLQGGEEAVSIREGYTCDMAYYPCEDCTVQVVDLETDEMGNPCSLLVHTFSHVFVPEYGFDMVWRSTQQSFFELVFAAMLHSTAGAATYLVKWRTFHTPTASNYVFMACIDGASTEFCLDRQQAMLAYGHTRCSSRIEIASDANYIFFDTISKFGILRFDQTEDPNSSRVTRAVFSNNSGPGRRRSRSTSPTHTSGEYYNMRVGRTRRARALSQQNVGNPPGNRSPIQETENINRVNRMSPDGKLLCSVLFVDPSLHKNAKRVQQVEMRSSLTGKLIYQKRLIRRVSDAKVSWPSTNLKPEKSSEVAYQTLTFSDDSELVVLWDIMLTNSQVSAGKGPPVVIQAISGLVVQDFSGIPMMNTYEDMQMAPDGRTIYGTRLCGEKGFIDALDVLSGEAMKTVFVGDTFSAWEEFARQGTFILPDNISRTVARGWLDSLWQTTQGYVGCGWKACRRKDEKRSIFENHDN